MCVGCRERTGKSGLLRLAWDDAVVLDTAQTRPGRGAYLHRDRACIEQALRRRAVPRALRVSSAQLTLNLFADIEFEAPAAQGIE